MLQRSFLSNHRSLRVRLKGRYSGVCRITDFCGTTEIADIHVNFLLKGYFKEKYFVRSCLRFCHSHSDGTSRTGTYILIDMVLNRMAKGESVKTKTLPRNITSIPNLYDLQPTDDAVKDFEKSNL